MSDNYSSLRSSLKKIDNKKLEKMIGHAELKKMSDKEVQRVLLLANGVSVDQARKLLDEMTHKKEKEGKQLDEFFKAIRAEDAEQKSKIEEILKEFEQEELATAKKPETLEVLKLALEWRAEGHELPVETLMKLEYLHAIEQFFENKKELILELKNLHQELIELNESFDKGTITAQDLDQKLPNLEARLTKVLNDSELTVALASHNKVKESPAVLEEILANPVHKARHEEMAGINATHEGLEFKFMQLAEKLHKQRHAGSSNSAAQSSQALSIPARSLSLEKEKRKPENDLGISPGS